MLYTVVELIGLIGNLLLAFNGIPLAIAALAQGKLKAPPTFIYAWLAGEIMTMMYLFGTKGFDWYFAINFTVNIACAGICVVYLDKDNKETK